jgi:hypothetical protein
MDDSRFVKTIGPVSLVVPLEGTEPLPAHPEKNNLLVRVPATTVSTEQVIVDFHA